jgi:2-iminobutanoate/2-iminopropanoate deaminase
MRVVVSTAEGAQAIGPYSQAIKTSDMIFVSGQIALDPGTGQIVAGGIEAHTERALQSVEAILKAAGSDLSLVVRCVVYLTDMEHFDAMNRVYEQFFGKNKPARSTVAVSALPRRSLVEIEVTALT